MRIKKTETQHMNSLGKKWGEALAAASLSVRLDPKLVGLDKIRGPLAIAAALKATGCPDHDGFVVPKEAGPPITDFQNIIDAAFAAAVDAAKLTVRQPA